jgi:hypothetical protein
LGCPSRDAPAAGLPQRGGSRGADLQNRVLAQEASLEELVSVAGRRWMLEITFEAAKQEAAVDQYEFRKWGV